ncbi:MAG: hypothetical protein IK114_02420 [Fibrobacter sp.]|nr:hypothetical protein [Fibrobacter sp.]
MRRNRLGLLLFWMLALALCLCACSDNSSSAKADAKTLKIKVAVMAKSSEMARWKRSAEWALENMEKAQGGLDQKVELQLEFKNQDDADIDEYMEKVAHDTDYVAVVGPTQSDKAYRMAELLQKSEKPILSPKASNVEYQRFFANMPNLWNLVENDFMLIESAFSHLASSFAAIFKNELELTLLAPSSELNGGLVSSYVDWIGFMAEEFGLKIDRIFLYNDEAELRMLTQTYLERKKPYSVLLFEPYDDKMALAFDDELYQQDVASQGGIRVVCSSNFVSDSIVKNLHYDFYRGFDLYARPESGFAQAYHEHFGEDILNGEAHFVDALYILAYAATYSVSSGLELNESIRAVLGGRDGTGGDWMIAGMHENFMSLQNGRLPDLTGVSSSWTFQDRDNSVSGSVYRGWNIADHKYVTNDFTSNDDSKHSINPEENWLDFFKAVVDTSFFEYADSNISYNDVSKHWALLVAASSGWANYRFQADIFAIYQKLKKMGYDDDHIIMIAEDDLANHRRNLYPGELFIRLDGDNVYEKGVVDYKLSYVTASDLGNILRGNSSDKLLKVLRAKSTDNVFVFWSGHGIPGYLNFGNDKISYEQIISLVKQIPHRKVLVAVEACYSGGLGETAEKADIPGIVFLTAASPYETSKADERNEEMGVYLTNRFTRGFTELLDETPDATLRDMYVEIASKISGSHVQLYNMSHYGNIYKEKLDEFFVIK